MQQSDIKWWQNGWMWGAIILALISAAFTIVAEIYNWTQCIWGTIGGSVLGFLATMAAFACGIKAHSKQTRLLEEMEPLVKDIYNIVTNEKSINNIENVKITESALTVYVKLTLYAMYHACTNRKKNAIKCKTISKKYPNLIALIVQSIFAAFKSSDIMGRIADDGCIVIDEFNKEVPKDCTDAKELLRGYEHMNGHAEIRKSINRINKACGMNQI